MTPEKILYNMAVGVLLKEADLFETKSQFNENRDAIGDALRVNVDDAVSSGKLRNSYPNTPTRKEFAENFRKIGPTPERLGDMKARGLIPENFPNASQVPSGPGN